MRAWLTECKLGALKLQDWTMKDWTLTDWTLYVELDIVIAIHKKTTSPPLTTYSKTTRNQRPYIKAHCNRYSKE